MMKIPHILLFLFLSSMLLASCVRDDNNPFSGGGVPVEFTTGLSATGISAQHPSTRATNDTWDKNDSVGIYMVPYNANTATAADFTAYEDSLNKKYIVTSLSDKDKKASLSSVGYPIVYPADPTETVSFVAYYPYMKAVSNATNKNIYPVDVTTQNPLAKIDLLYYKGTTEHSSNNRQVNLNFTHQLSKLTITVVRKDVATIDFTNADADAFLIGFPRKAKFDLSKDTLTDISDASTILSPLTPVKQIDIKSPADSVVFESIVVPHKGKDYTRTIRMDIDGTTYSYTLPATRDFESGTVYSYRFTFTGDGLDMGESTISNWGSSTVGDIEFSVSTNSIELGAAATTGNTFTIKTNSVPTPTCSISTSATSVVTPGTNWITNVSFGTPSVSNGWKTYTVTFNTIANTSETIANELYLHLKIAEGKTLVVKVKQEKKIYLRTPSPNSFSFLAAAQKSSFTVKTNSMKENLTVSYSTDGTIANTVSRPSWIITESPTFTETGNEYTYTIPFEALDNPEGNAARSIYIHVSIDGLNDKVKVSQAEFDANGILGDAGGADGSQEANCYIVAPGGKTQRFSVKKAIGWWKAYNNTTVGNFTVEKLWDDNNVIGTPAVTSDGKVSVTTTSNHGNALIAIKSGGVIRWSYHIWVTDYNPNNNTYTNAYAYDGKNYSFIFMNRNLGATFAGVGSGKGTGLFYQWGRKDPFPATGAPGETQVGGGSFIAKETSAILGTIENTIKTPNVVYVSYDTDHKDWLYAARDNTLWGNLGDKAIYDPCPYGWRVPTNSLGYANTSPWVGFNDSTFSEGWVWGDNAAYPASGYRSYFTGLLIASGTQGYLWSASSYGDGGDSASYLSLSAERVMVNASNARSLGMLVRCVRE